MEDNKIIRSLAKNEKFVKVIIKIGKKSYLKRFTENIGKLVEEEDRFICYVNPKKIKKDKYGMSELSLNAFNSNWKDMIKVYKFYGVNKPIYYVIDGIIFENVLYIKSYGEAYIIFRNCEFNENIIIKYANSVTFEKNKYFDHSPIYFSGSQKFFYGYADEVRFINDKFYNSDEKHHPCSFGMNIEATKVEIINSNINIDNTVEWEERKVASDIGALEIKAKEIIINDSIINAPMICLSGDNINIDEDSLVKSKNLVMIDNSNEDLENFNIESPCFVYNGVEFNNDKKLIIEKEDIKIQKERTNLINVMRAILNEGLKSNEKEVEEIKKRPLRRILKR